MNPVKFQQIQQWFLRLLLGLSIAQITGFAHAVTFLPRMDQAQWISRSHVLNCSLIQPIPAFGRAVFDYTSGDKLKFYLESSDNPFEQGQATLTSQASTWHPEQPEESMGIVKVKAGGLPIELDKRLATYLLAELYKGKSPSFSRKAWYVEDEPVEVAMSAATFREAYASYRNCIGRLLPVGFDQIERSKVRFPVDDWVLDTKARAWLDILVMYLTQAPDVEQFYIDGHTDSTHTTTYNIALSKKRAESVQTYLVENGVSPNLVSIRFHGERFPVASNKSIAGRAENRRVTMRVELAIQAQGKALARR